MKLLSTSEAAAALGVSERRIRGLITDGRLPAEKIGRDYVIKEVDLELVRERKPGRPRKSPTAKRKR